MESMSENKKSISPKWTDSLSYRTPKESILGILSKATNDPDSDLAILQRLLMLRRRVVGTPNRVVTKRLAMSFPPVQIYLFRSDQQNKKMGAPSLSHSGISGLRWDLI